MDKKIIEKIQAAFEADEDNRKNFMAYDAMDAMQFDFKKALQPWMVPSVSTAPAVALKTFANTFDTRNPHVEILPFGEADREAAERAERWAEYHLLKIGQRGSKSPLRQIPYSAGKYGRIGFQVDYLKYWLPKDESKWTNEQKEQIRNGIFCWEIHNPLGFVYEMGKYGLRWVAAVSNMAAVDIINHWGVYDDGGEKGKKIQAAIRKIEKKYEENEDIRFIYVDYTDYEKRQVSIFETTREDVEVFEDFDEGTERIDIVDSKNELGFLNWVVVECDSSPLLEQVHKGGLYTYTTMFDTIKKSGILRRALPPTIVSKTVDGQGVAVEWTGAQSEIKLNLNESVEPFIPPPLDQAVFNLSQEEAGRMDQALGVSKLSGMEASNVQFSTVSALIDLNLTAIEQYKRTSEKATEHGVYLMFRWVEYTKDTVSAYRMKKALNKPVGEQIVMSMPKGYSDTLHINVTLTSKQDKVQAYNRITMLKNAGFEIDDAELLEEVGYDNPELLASRYRDQVLKAAALQNLLKKLQGQVDLELKAADLKMQTEAQMQLQQSQQPPQDPNAQGDMGQMANPDQGMPSNPQGEGFNGAMGGTPPMMAEPGMTAQGGRAQ